MPLEVAHAPDDDGAHEPCAANQSRGPAEAPSHAALPRQQAERVAWV